MCRSHVDPDFNKLKKTYKIIRNSNTDWKLPDLDNY